MPEFFPSLQWAQPLFLLLALLPFAKKFIGLGALSSSRLAKHYEGFIEPHLLQYMLIYPKSSRLASVLAFLAWFFAATALAGPSLKQTTFSKNISPPKHKITVMVDISRSMLTQDILPNRITRVKRELQELASQLPHDRFALIAYAANAYLVAPFTDDQGAFLQFTESLSPTLTQQQGSNLIQALELARSITPQRGHIVLLTDGGIQSIASDVLKAAQRLDDKNIRLMILGVGTIVGGPIVDDFGKVLSINGKMVQSRLNSELLQKLSARTNGAYSDLASDSSDWQALLSVFRATDSSDAVTKQTSVEYRPLFPFFLALSLTLFLVLILQGRPLLSLFVIIAFMLPNSTLQASPLSHYYENQGWQALQQGDTQSAMRFYKKTKSYAGRLGLGVSLYRQEQWTQAATAFAEALNQAKSTSEVTTARYNLGNTQAKMEQYLKARQSFQQVLQLEPQHKRARSNLKQVNQFLQQKQSQAKAEQKKQMPQMKPSLIMSEASGQDVQDSRPTIIEIPPTGSTFEEDAQTVHAPSVNEALEPLLRYRFNQFDERNQPLLTGNPW